METLKEIEQKYINGDITSDTDEKGAGGYWDLAGEIVSRLTDNGLKQDQLQTGIYGVFQKVLTRGDLYQ